MNGIRVPCHDPGFVEKSEEFLFACLGDRALASKWRVETGEFVGPGGAIMGPDSQLEVLLPDGSEYSGEQLLRLFQEVIQFINAKFEGRESEAVAPWVVLIVYDSTYWEVFVDDDGLLAEVTNRFVNPKRIAFDQRTEPFRRLKRR